MDSACLVARGWLKDRVPSGWLFRGESVGDGCTEDERDGELVLVAGTAYE